MWQNDKIRTNKTDIWIKFKKENLLLLGIILGNANVIW